MKSLLVSMSRLVRVFLLLGGVALAFPAHAAYVYTVVDYPAEFPFTEVFGINNKGQIVGVSTDNFVYDAKAKVFTVLPTLPGFGFGSIGINEPGVIVGSATDLNTFVENGAILDKGAFTLFSHPGSQFFTEARAINNQGLITGYADTDGGNTVSGFIYDPKSNSFIDILPSLFTVAQGINNRGDVVGSVELDSNGAYPGSPAGSYGFLRHNDGTITLFRVNGFATTARGITDSGVVTGSAGISGAPGGIGYVTKLAPGAGFQALTIPAASLLAVPGATQTVPEGISNSGVIVGIWLDANFNFHGFLATQK